MKFGIFSNGMRRNAVAADSFDADIAEIVTADTLGYDEAWVSEHFGGWLPDSVPNAELLIAKAAGMTKQIKLGPAVRLLPLYHPLDVATSAAQCDHLMRGRYLFGFGSGVPFLKNMERRGMTNAMRHPMMMESIQYILKCWTSAEPFDWDGEYWHGKAISILPKCFQAPHPPIAVASGQEAMVRMAAENGWTVMVSQFEPPEAIRRRGDAYVGFAEAHGVTPDRSKVTVCRQIYVTDSVAQARQDMRRDISESLEEWKQINPERFRGFMPSLANPADINFDQACDSGLFIGGDPDSVFGQLKDVYERANGFGTLLLIMGKDWGTPEQRTRSMTLFKKEVAPRLAALTA